MWVAETPIGKYRFESGTVSYDDPLWGDWSNVGDASDLEEAERLVQEDIPRRVRKQEEAEARRKQQEARAARSLSDQLLDMAEDIRRDGFQALKSRYEYSLRQLQGMGMLTPALMRKVNRLNRGMSTLESVDSEDAEKAAKVLEMLSAALR